MRLHCLVVFAVGLVCMGCTHTVEISRDEPDSVLTKLASQLSTSTFEKEAQIVLLNGVEANGSDVKLRRDSTSWRVHSQSRKLVSSDTAGLKMGNIRVQSDSSSWIIMETVQTETASNTDIRSVTIVDRGKGAVEGLEYGFLSGVILLGVVIGMDHVTHPQSYPGEGSEYVILAFPVAGLAGSLLGLINGASLGSKEQYIFSTQKK